MEGENFIPSADRETKLRVIEYVQLELAGLKSELSPENEARKKEIEKLVGMTRDQILKMGETIILS